MPKTDFPKKGDDREISLRNSTYRQFDHEYAMDLRENWPDIWNKGGNIRGNSAFTNWGKARKGETTAAVKAWIKEREAWIARHYDNKLLAGVVAQIKWGAVGSRGMSFMKSVVNEAKKKSKKGDNVNIEIKKACGEVKYVNDPAMQGGKVEEYKGVKCGVVCGYIATWNKDRGNDVFHKGAFLESLNEWKSQGRDPKVKDMHGNSIGVYPIDKMYEDETGLYGEAYVNIEIQQGKEALSKARMGIYDRKSIGFSADPKTTKGQFPNGRDIYKAHIWEGSLVDEPMNVAALITDVKSVTSYQDLPLGDGAKVWDSTEAEKRVRIWAGAEDAPNDKYKRAFLWFDASAPEEFGSYKFPIADVVDDELKALPRAIYAAAAAVQGARGGAKISDEDKQKIRAHLDRYYSKLDKESPWGKKMLGDLLGTNEEIKEMSVRDVEQKLRDAGCSQEQAKALISNIKGIQANEEEEQERKSFDTLGGELDKILANL